MRIVFLAEGKLAPSSRFRVQQFIPWFERQGVECVVHYGYGARYNEVSGTPWAPLYKVLARARRLALGLKDAQSADVLFIQRPIFPFSPLPEKLLKGLNSRIVFDVDDAVFLGPDSQDSKPRRASFDGCVAAARRYIAGNRYLAEQGGALHKTTIIPTVIDTDRYTPRTTPRGNDQVVIGWIGSGSTLQYLDEVLPALRAVRDAHENTVIRIVCSHMPPHLAQEERFEFVPWSAQGEIPALQDFDIGIMPLTPSRISLGKCGFKMIQYMAVGIPVVSSPVGANVDIFKDSGAGYLATTHDDWVDALDALVRSPQARAASGESAREHAVKGYSIHAVLPRYLEIFRAVAGSEV